MNALVVIRKAEHKKIGSFLVSVADYWFTKKLYLKLHCLPKMELDFQ